ncbi:MAG TPA: toll/interleukin-1 receptor domain-containing protein, partial [Bryobacteraceae bacterium]
ERAGLITEWSDRQIPPGAEWPEEIKTAMERAGIILLLLSADFIASKYCYEIEMPYALQRHRDGQAVVVPILLRSVVWQDTPLANLQMLPTGALPVASWPRPDDAFTEIAASLRALIYNKRLAVIAPEPSAPGITELAKRVFDSAIAASVQVDQPTDVVVMVRTKESAGLKGILRVDTSYAITEQDVKSTNLTIEFEQKNGKLLAADLSVTLEAPGFDPPQQVKSLHIPPKGNSEVTVFLLTPQKTGSLLLNLDIRQGTKSLGSRLLRTAAVPGEAMGGYAVVSVPIDMPNESFVRVAAPASTTAIHDRREIPFPKPQSARSRHYARHAVVAASLVLLSVSVGSVFWKESLPNLTTPVPSVTDRSSNTAEAQRPTTARPEPSKQPPDAARNPPKGLPGNEAITTQKPRPSAEPEGAVAELAAARERFIELRSKTSVTKSALAQTRRQLPSATVNAAIAQSEKRLDTYISGADRALQVQDSRDAKRYMDLAERELQKLSALQ